MTGSLKCIDKIALKLAVENLLLVPNCCRKHLYNWRKRYFNSKGIFKVEGIDWSKNYSDSVLERYSVSDDTCRVHNPDTISTLRGNSP